MNLQTFGALFFIAWPLSLIVGLLITRTFGHWYYRRKSLRVVGIYRRDR